MTTTTPDATTIPAVTDRSVPATPHAIGAGFAATATETAKRTIKQFFRTPQLLMMGTIQGALFLFMFRYVFGGAISPGGDLDYVNFLVPGFLVTVIAWPSSASAAVVTRAPWRSGMSG